MDKIFKRTPRGLTSAPGWSTITEYAPVFTSYSGGIYEQELTRAAIDRFASACSKLKPEVAGSAKPRLRRAFETSPNQYTTWPRFLYRLATIVECDTTACVVPTFDGADGETVVGIWPLKFALAEIVDYKGEPWVRFYLDDGEMIAIELRNVCFISKYQYQSDFFGSLNVLESTMALIDAQAQAQKEAIKAGATIRFIGALEGQVRESDMEEKRKRFTDVNLSKNNTSGLLLYDQTFRDIRQIEPYSYTISAEEMERINESVYSYFGINEDILQNHFNEDHWDAYYEGRVEPFALQLSEGLTQMLYTQREVREGNRVMFSTNRLEYATSASKRNMIRDMLDRGVMSINEAREILQMPPVPDGDERVIRGEYIDATMLSSPTGDSDPSQHDLVKKESDYHEQVDKPDHDA